MLSLHHQPILNDSETGRDAGTRRKQTRLVRVSPRLRVLVSVGIWWLRVELNHQPRAYETLALFHLSYTAVMILEARGGVEPRAFPPSSS
jgi:hypothetical protein